MPRPGFFPTPEFERRLALVRQKMAEQNFDGCLISCPENIYYISGLDHQGYFACHLLVVPLDATPILITRAMERPTVEDQVPSFRHIGYTDGAEPLPSPKEEDLVLASKTDEGPVFGLEPWSTSFGVPTRKPEDESIDLSAPVRATCQAIKEAGLDTKRIGLEKKATFLSLEVAEGLAKGLPKVQWDDASGLVDDCRVVQSPLELACTRRAAEISNSMMLSAIAAAGPGVPKREVMAAVYDAMFRRGGTYPGFVPLVRSTRTLKHEHGTWDGGKLRYQDILFLEMAACVRRYHAPVGRLVFIGKAPARAEKINQLCLQAMEKAASKIGPGVKACEVYRAWQECLNKAGLSHYRRHHCGYAVGIGFPPSWSGSGVPVGLRDSSSLELKPGMVFHLMSWLLRTGRGDSFLSDTIVVTENGCEFLTNVRREVTVR